MSEADFGRAVYNVVQIDRRNKYLMYFNSIFSHLSGNSIGKMDIWENSPNNM